MAKRNYVVHLVGLAATDVEVVAATEEDAVEIALEWARGRSTADEHNNVALWDWELDRGADPPIEIADDQSMLRALVAVNGPSLVAELRFWLDYWGGAESVKGEGEPDA